MPQRDNQGMSNFETNDLPDPAKSDIMNEADRTLWTGIIQAMEGKLTQIPLYIELQRPIGNLASNRASHALWYYYICSMKAYEQSRDNAIVVVAASDTHAPTNAPRYRQVLVTISAMYGLLPDTMVKHWISIDKEADRQNLPRMPKHDEKFKVPMRFSGISARPQSVIALPEENPHVLH